MVSEFAVGAQKRRYDPAKPKSLEKKSASKGKKYRTLSDSTLIPSILPHHYRTGAISTDRPKSPRRNTHIYVTTALSSRRCSSQDLLTVFNMACI